MAKSNGEKSSKHSFLLDNTQEITRRFALGVREVVLDHELDGSPVAIWRDGKVVIVPPEEIRQELTHQNQLTKTK